LAKKYRHKIHGWQVRYTVYLPGGPAIRYKFTQSSDLANELVRVAEMVEMGSRRGDLSPREIQLAVNHGLLSAADHAGLAGEKYAAMYDLAKVLDRWRTSVKLSASPSTYKNYLRRVAWLERWFQSHPIPSLTVADVKRYLHDRREGLLAYPNAKNRYTVAGVSQSTLVMELHLMRMVIDEAVALRMVETNVAREVSVKVRQQKFRRSFSADEIAALIASAEQNRHLCHGQAYEVVMVALYSGLRLSEIRTLQWVDVDIPSRRLAIQSKDVPGESPFSPKGGVAAATTIPDRLAAIFEAMPRNGLWVFGGKKPLPSFAFWRSFKLICERAGLPKELSLHHARHTYGSWLLRMTGDLVYVMGEMRHADVATTKNYMHSTHAGSPAKGLDFTVPLPPRTKEPLEKE